MTVSAFPKRVRVDGSSLITFKGDPYVAVSWSLTGTGTLTPNSSATDASGHATAVYTPGMVGETVTIEVEHG